MAATIGVFCLDIQLFVLGGRQVAECFVESFVVVEADPLEGLVFDVLEAGEAAARRRARS